MSKILEYTMSNYDQSISLNQIANLANLTPNTVCKYFKSRTNKTYVQFLTDIRIEQACKLLSKEKDLSVSEIVLASSFSNVSNFNRKIKLLKQKTPVQYRKMYSF